jgi:type IV fimbrial biogenesis protein FimT
MFKNALITEGYTLIELVATMAIAGTLLALAIPSFNATLTSSRLTSYANDFVSALNLARSEAVRRGIAVTVSKKGTLPDWGKEGWTVFVDINGNGINNSLDNLCSTSTIGAATEDCILRAYPPLTTGYSLTTTDNNAVVYLPSGLITAQNEKSFTLCSGITSKSIIITIVGRAYISSGVVTVESC